MFNPETWAAVPFHFWSLVYFVFGSIVGSFLNVCIYRLPRDESVVSPPSHCPHCGYSIPWYFNMPLVTWLWLGAKCANCRAPISSRYFIVELLTGVTFLVNWLVFGHQSAGIALVYCMLMAGLIVATFIDIEHFIIPDSITIGGVVAGFVASFLVPQLHQTDPTKPIQAFQALKYSMMGIMGGWVLVYGVVRAGKLLFGKQKIKLEPDTKLIFTEDHLVFPDEQILFGDIFYRNTDTIELEAKKLELPDRCYQNVRVRLSPEKLRIADESCNPDTVPHMEVITDKIIIPREAMGFGDVKFMAAIGAFIGWQGVVFSLMMSSFIGAAVGLTLIALKKRDWSNLLPYGPFIAVAAVIWIFFGKFFHHYFFGI